MRIVLKDFEEVLEVLKKLVGFLIEAFGLYILYRNELKKAKRKAAVSHKKRRSRNPRKI